MLFMQLKVPFRSENSKQYVAEANDPNLKVPKQPCLYYSMIEL